MPGACAARAVAEASAGEGRGEGTAIQTADLKVIRPDMSDFRRRPIAELLRESGAVFTTHFPDASCVRGPRY